MTLSDEIGPLDIVHQKRKYLVKTAKECVIASPRWSDNCKNAIFLVDKTRELVGNVLECREIIDN